MKFLNVNGYAFFEVANPENLKESLLELATSYQVLGSILIATEGVNLSLAGAENEVESFCKRLHEICEIEPIAYKLSWTEKPPFKRFWIKVKKEIVTMGFPELALKESAPYVKPNELREWFKENKELFILDTRKEFEFQMGHFKGAKSLDSKFFRDFPERLKELNLKKDATIVTYCTGGIRCEKAAPYLRGLGYENVFQLEGGILRYFEECGGEFWEGQCFVFDHRAAIDPELNVVESIACRSCGEVFNREFLSDSDCGLNMQCIKCLEEARAS